MVCFFQAGDLFCTGNAKFWPILLRIYALFCALLQGLKMRWCPKNDKYQVCIHVAGMFANMLLNENYSKITKISLLYVHWSSAGAECVLGVCWYENMNIYAPIPCLTREKLVHCFQYYSCDMILNLLCVICVDQISLALWIGLSGWGCLIAWIVFPNYVKPGFLSKLANFNWPLNFSSVEHL